jgi:transcription-repair coupling factor (superfamily II helicase)
MRLAEILEQETVVFLAADEQQGEAIAAALCVLRPDRSVIHLPSSDALPGDIAPASPANIGGRVAALHALRIHQNAEGHAPLACILSGEAAARLYPPATAFDTAPPSLSAGVALDLETFPTMLEALGYIVDDRVDEPGEMAIRGDVIDLFPADAISPARIDLAHGRITAIRAYDPISQLSTGDIDRLEIGRAAEPSDSASVPILEHLHPGAILLSEQADRRRQRFLQLAVDTAGERCTPLDAVDEEMWTDALRDWRLVDAGENVQAMPRFAQQPSPLRALKRFVSPLIENKRIFLLVGSERDLRFLRPRVAKAMGLSFTAAAGWSDLLTLASPNCAALFMPVEAGYFDERYVVVAAADLLGSRALVGEAETRTANPWAMGGVIQIGDVVVHEDHGVGLVTGLEPTPVAKGGASEMIAIDYAGGDRRLVALEAADRIWRYGADAGAVTLDRLNGSSWQKRRGAIEAAIAQSAKGLTALAAERAKPIAPLLEPDPAAYERFVGGFPFTETADQARAIAAVRDDLARGTPMNRLVIGDVGFGKTEVALRAAALAALTGYQVIIAAPTTVLVRQHLESFRRRFERSGIKVAGLSRLSTTAEKKAVKAGLADGTVQIVIGTAAVMAKDVRYAKLGLVVIDEEQRFGAADKAKLRGSGETHLLTLSATPIPRTLQMALTGLQQISVIATPPARRQPIRTALDHFDDGGSELRSSARRAGAARASSSCRASRICRSSPKGSAGSRPNICLSRPMARWLRRTSMPSWWTSPRARAISSWQPTSSKPGSTSPVPIR